MQPQIAHWQWGNLIWSPRCHAFPRAGAKWEQPYLMVWICRRRNKPVGNRPLLVYRHPHRRGCGWRCTWSVWAGFLHEGAWATQSAEMQRAFADSMLWTGVCTEVIDRHPAPTYDRESFRTPNLFGTREGLVLWMTFFPWTRKGGMVWG